MNLTAIRAALSVAAIYGYFLMFAQFSFVEILRAAGISSALEKGMLGTMAAGGILTGFLTAWRGAAPGVARYALLGAAVAAAMAPWAQGTLPLLAVAATTGAALGLATVSLSSLLPSWCRVIWVGCGTGLGYAVCNLPALFLRDAGFQACAASGFALLGALVLPDAGKWMRDGIPLSAAGSPSAPTGRAMVTLLLVFTALVWMDSAAFFVIQHQDDLKSGTWGPTLLWRNAGLHLGFALVAGLWLERKGVWPVLVSAWILLAIASLLVNQASTRNLAGWLYPAGVSLYSTALVAWPGWFAHACGPKSAAWRAAWLFAVAGWIGSANGIGMAQSLRQVPPAFVVIAGLVVLVAMLGTERRHWRTALAIGAVLLTGWIGGATPEPFAGSAATRGRGVYLSEGCIHCHTRYVRPDTSDESRWGTAAPVEAVVDEEPVLIGNRRQGPDLAHVGARRSEAWLAAHFQDPRALVPGSRMPSYAHLFEDGRGDDLVRYLRESGIQSMENLMARQRAWKPAMQIPRADGAKLFSSHCAACHGADGRGRGPLAGRFPVQAPDLRHGPFPRTSGPEDVALQIARVIKFGVIGSEMPGHETLNDGEIMALARLLSAWRAE